MHFYSKINSPAISHPKIPKLIRLLFGAKGEDSEQVHASKASPSFSRFDYVAAVGEENYVQETKLSKQRQRCHCLRHEESEGGMSGKLSVTMIAEILLLLLPLD